MLTARTAAKVLTRQQHASTLIAWLVKHKIGIQRTVSTVLTRLALIHIAPLIKQILAKASALDRLEKLLGNDLIGVYVGTIQRRYQASVLSKWLHALTS